MHKSEKRCRISTRESFRFHQVLSFLDVSELSFRYTPSRPQFLVKRRSFAVPLEEEGRFRVVFDFLF